MLMDEYGDENSQPLGAWVREADTGVLEWRQILESVEWSQRSGVDKIQYSSSLVQSSIRSHKSKVKSQKAKSQKAQKAN